MPNIDETDRDFLADFDHLAVTAWMQPSDRLFRIIHGVHRFIFRISGTFALAVAPLSFKLLYVGAVLQHNVAEITGLCGREYGTFEPVLAQEREFSGVVDVGVGQ